MGFYNKVTGADITAEINEYDQEISKLPNDYQEVWTQIVRRLQVYSDFSGRNLLPLYRSTVDFLVEMAAEGKSIEQVFGDDLNGYCDALTSGMTSNDMRAKLRGKLNKNIQKKLDK